jgi:hypothetical protein
LIPAGFHVSRGTQEPLESGLHFQIRGSHPLWPAFPCRSLNAPQSLFYPGGPPPLMPPARLLSQPRRPRQQVSWLLWSYDPDLSFRIDRFRLFRFRSPLLSESRLFSSPPGTEMVHFPGFARYAYRFSAPYLMFTPGGFPHSDISGSQVACTSPKLFAAGHVLHRLFVPRHPHACS